MTKIYKLPEDEKIISMVQREDGTIVIASQKAVYLLDREGDTPVLIPAEIKKS